MNIKLIEVDVALGGESICSLDNILEIDNPKSIVDELLSNDLWKKVFQIIREKTSHQGEIKNIVLGYPDGNILRFPIFSNCSPWRGFYLKIYLTIDGETALKNDIMGPMLTKVVSDAEWPDQYHNNSNVTTSMFFYGPTTNLTRTLYRLCVSNKLKSAKTIIVEADKSLVPFIIGKNGRRIEGAKKMLNQEGFKCEYIKVVAEDVEYKPLSDNFIGFIPIPYDGK